MADIWFISDHHFFHENMLRFTQHDGSLMRPGFGSVEEMNEVMVQRWNSVVKPQDKVWHLGDVAFKTTDRASAVAALLQRLAGHKRLVVGNHDNLKAPSLMNNFEKVQLWKGFKDEGFTCTHIPIPLEHLRDGAVNVHGHVHHNTLNKPGYINVSVEVRDYTPVHMDQIIAEVRKAT